MANIVFYEKPGCINNSKQKKLLRNAGHQVESRNLLTESWSRSTLLEYFDSMVVSRWFNSSAPDIKSGQIDPSTLSEDAALELMIENPILIRRPLMRVGEKCRVGFDVEHVDQWIGLGGLNVASADDSDKQSIEDLETCQQPSGHSCKAPVLKMPDTNVHR